MVEAELSCVANMMSPSTMARPRLGPSLSSVLGFYLIKVTKKNAKKSKIGKISISTITPPHRRQPHCSTYYTKSPAISRTALFT